MTTEAGSETETAAEARRVATAEDLVLQPFGALAAPDLYGILQLRSQVFVVEQDCLFLDLDGTDMYPDTVHAFIPATVIGRDPLSPFRDTHGEQTGLNAMPAAYARVLPAGLIDGPAGEPGARSIGRVVTDGTVRHRRLGTALMGGLVDRFGRESVLTLNAQAHLRGFYEGFGFTVSGAEFLEDGIPHLPMRRPQD